MILNCLSIALFIGVCASAAPVTVLVIDNSSGRPLSDAELELAGNGRSSTATTNVNGIAVLALPDSIYCLRVQKDGYVDPLQDARSGCHVVELKGGKLVLPLVHSCSISGNVTDDQGNPVQSAEVIAIAPFHSGQTRVQPIGEAEITDDRGMYRLFGLAPGRYSVAVYPSGENTTTAPFATTFLGGRDYREAQFLNLRAGDAAESINLSVDLNASPRSKITGTITHACLTSKCHASVMLFSRNGFTRPVDQCYTDEDGKFGFDNIPAGDYFIAAWTPPVEWPVTNKFPGTISRAAIAPVSLSDEGRIELSLLPTISIRAHISTPAAKGPPAPCPDLDQLGLQSEDGWPNLSMSTVSANQVQWGPLPPGSYHIVAPPLPNSCELVSIQDGSRVRSGNQPVHLDAETATLELSFAAPAGEISGVVNAGSSRSTEDYVVLLGSDQSYLRRVVQTYNSHFSFTNLPGGSYSIAAFADVNSAADFSLTAAKDVQVVTISGSRQQINDLTLTLREPR